MRRTMLSLQDLKVQSFVTKAEGTVGGFQVATLGFGCEITFPPICESLPPGCATDQGCMSQEGICL